MGKTKINLTHAMKILFLLGIIMVTNLAYVTSFFAMFGEQMENVESGVNNYDAYIRLVPIISLSSIILADYLQMARFFRKKNLEVVADTLKFAFIQTLITLATKDLTGERAFPRSVILLSFIVIIIYIFTWQMCCMIMSRKVFETGNLVIIGSNTATMNQVKDKIFPSLKSVDLDFSRLVKYSDKRAVRSVIKSNVEIFLCPDVPEDVKSDIILQCAKYNTVVYVVPQFYEISLYKAKVINLNDLMVMMMDRMGLTFEQRLFKRIFDIIISVIALILSSPIIALSAVIIKLTDGGPVFFRQERLTINNKPYKIFKLRTMRIDAERETGAVISGKNDPRVTYFGKFLRRSKIDEVPQFLNVLMGDMSVVGPRSERPEFVSSFEKEIPGYSQRFAVKAGITGLAQVAGNYDTTAQDKLRYDLLYIKNYSILQDIKIIFMTIRAVFTPHLYNQSFEDNKKTIVSTEAAKIMDNKVIEGEDNE
ncbi:MAG: sugar transferase [Saccharofermentans sp.]|nr:sugar transferase [Saccharofermentans sp.]